MGQEDSGIDNNAQTESRTPNEMLHLLDLEDDSFCLLHSVGMYGEASQPCCLRLPTRAMSREIKETSIRYEELD